MSVTLLTLIAVFLAFCAWTALLKKQQKSFSTRVLSALAGGLLFGGVIQLTLGVEHVDTRGFAEFISVFGKGYVKLLQLMVIPLVFVAMISSIMNVDGTVSLSRIAPKIIGVLLVTVSLSAVIGVAAVYLFGIDGAIMVSSSSDSSAIDGRSASLVATQESLVGNGIASLVLSIIPTNVFEMLTGSQSTSTLSTVLFAMFLGYSVLKVKKTSPEKVQSFIDLINSAKEVVLSMVRLVLELTPYGVFALMTSFMMQNDLFALAEMGRFLLASYLAMLTMYLVHIAIIFLSGLSPLQFVRKSWPVLMFGFTSRSSMAAIPLNVESQNRQMGVDEETANMSATFGTSIGQNGCAGNYPAMLAILAAQAMGVPIDLSFLLQLVAVIAISSFGIAGVGGGATFAAVAVLTIMGLDITVVAILVSIESLIDMARTALNISGSMLSGLLTAKQNGTLDQSRYNSAVPELQQEKA